MDQLVTEDDLAEAQQLLDAVGAVLEGRDPVLVEAVITGILLSHALGHACLDHANEAIEDVRTQALEQVQTLWPQREVFAAGGLN